jgi:NitT/TauT family transport system ATP-binding protein
VICKARFFRTPGFWLDRRGPSGTRLKRGWRESGKTIVLVTHSIQEAVFLASHCAVLTASPARMAEYFPIDLPFPRVLPIKTTDEFGSYARRIYESLGLGTTA